MLHRSEETNYGIKIRCNDNVLTTYLLSLKWSPKRNSNTHTSPVFGTAWRSQNAVGIIYKEDRRATGYVQHANSI
ncbi:hypothetical protein XELAEV_18017134mg [Xenopus laevis]|uniref:Uncharacterized protein n=1 Tax=Xenopus laevis TaxID=8355 RepID=A0A974DAN3_XENLA|nr:hypothetical protein XELAEV_18017134mg [Xenopus laevis]